VESTWLDVGLPLKRPDHWLKRSDLRGGTGIHGMAKRSPWRASFGEGGSTALAALQQKLVDELHAQISQKRAGPPHGDGASGLMTHFLPWRRNPAWLRICKVAADRCSHGKRWRSLETSHGRQHLPDPISRRAPEDPMRVIGLSIPCCFPCFPRRADCHR